MAYDPEIAAKQHKKIFPGVLFIASRSGETDIFMNSSTGEKVSIKRDKTRRCKGEKQYCFRAIVEGKDHEEYGVRLTAGIEDKVSIKGIEMFLGRNPARNGIVDLGYKIPKEWKLERKFPYAKPLQKYFTWIDAMVELHFNHGLRFTEEAEKYLLSYKKEDRL